jgi:hypothetical protein
MKINKLAKMTLINIRRPTNLHSLSRVRSHNLRAAFAVIYLNLPFSLAPSAENNRNFFHEKKTHSTEAKQPHAVGPRVTFHNLLPSCRSSSSQEHKQIISALDFDTHISIPRE